MDWKTSRSSPNSAGQKGELALHEVHDLSTLGQARPQKRGVSQDVGSYRGRHNTHACILTTNSSGALGWDKDESCISSVEVDNCPNEWFLGWAFLTADSCTSPVFIQEKSFTTCQGRKEETYDTGELKLGLAAIELLCDS